ncbi:MAG: tripartite tricarboxylate transporter substrate binding protein [Pigmentiphaga sp.]|nr:tripartite tricarboxylate transporter substrate binding protein [Pigmentiphaga sp.]
MHTPTLPRWLQSWRLGLMAACLTTGLAATGAAQAQTYPDRAVSMVIPFGAGGGTDVLGRITSEPLARELGQPIVVENRGGAAGAIGTAVVAKADPDGYRLLFTAMAPITAAPNMPGANVPYDPQTDLAPIAMVARQPVLLVVNAKLPVASLEELIEYSKSNPEALAIGSPGAGTDMHLIGEQLKLATGANLLHVPYKGGGAAINDLIAGHIDAMVVVTSSIVPHIQSGYVKPLLTFDAERLPILPEVPTVAELGYPEVEGDSRWAMFGPPGLPPAVIDTVSGALQRVIADDRYQARLAELGVVPVYGDAEVLAGYTSDELEKWRQVVEAAGLKPE